MAETGEPLSDRELAVLASLVDGSTNREIAQNLHISPNTVKVHLRNIFAKLDVSSRTEATAVALQKGLLSLPGLETTDEFEDGGEPGFDVELAESELRGARNGTAVIENVPSSRPWRLVSLALGGLLLIAVLLLIGLQFLNNGSEATVETGPIEERIGDSRWYTSPPMPQPVSNMALAAVGLNLYRIGGEVEAGAVNLVNIYETDTGRWRTGAAKPTAVADTTAAVLFGEIFVMGGRLTNGRPTDVVEAYSPTNNAWRPIQPLPKPLSRGLALSNGNRLFLFGGWDGTNYLTDAYVYDLNIDAWNSLPPMTTGRAFAAGGLLDSKFYVVGGQNETGELAVCEFFDPETGRWSACPDMNKARTGAGAVALPNNVLYVIGGGADSEVYSLETDSWQPIDMPMLLTGESWQYLAVANVETRIFALGGRQGETILDAGYVFSPFVYETFLPAVGADE